MTLRKAAGKSRRPISLADAVDLDEENGLQDKRRPRKVMEELMHTSRSEYGRWMNDLELPLGKLLQWSEFCGSTHTIEYLALAAGKLVIDIPTGRTMASHDIHALQTVLNEAVGQILNFAAGKADAPTALAAIQTGMASLAWHKVNIEKHQQPELEFTHE